MISLTYPWLFWRNAVAYGIGVLLLHNFLPRQIEEDEDYRRRMVEERRQFEQQMRANRAAEEDELR